MVGSLSELHHMDETIHGNRKRIAYLTDVIRRLNPATVLDVGCGNGVFLTIPLAEAFPTVEFIGIDSDQDTIDLANDTNSCKNLRFVVNDKIPTPAHYDLVIASEVIEHVDDPEGFLDWLRTLTSDDGHIVVTTPNGYGPFETVTFVETLLDLSGVMKMLSAVPGLKKLKVGDSYSSGDVRSLQHDTLAISPHVNFFSLGVLTRIFDHRGLRVVEYRPRSFLGGLGFNQLMKSQSLLSWNSRISDSLPKRMVSGWMFVLKKSKSSISSHKIYARRWNEKFRRFITAKRWGVQ